MKVKTYTLVEDYKTYSWEDVWGEYKWEIGDTGTIEEWRKRAIDWVKNEKSTHDGKELIKELRKLPKDEVMLYISNLWGLDFMESEEER